MNGRKRVNVAKHPNGSSPPELGGVARRRFISRAGVVPKPEYRGLLALAEEPPRLRPLRKLRDIFLWAQPPLLTQEESFHSDASRPF